MAAVVRMSSEYVWTVRGPSFWISFSQNPKPPNPCKAPKPVNPQSKPLKPQTPKTPKTPNPYKAPHTFSSHIESLKKINQIPYAKQPAVILVLYTQIYMCKHRSACRAVLPFQDVVKLDLQAIDSCDDILPVCCCAV